MPNPVKVCETSDVPPGTGRTFEVAGRAVAVFNVDGTFYAIGNDCTHRGGPLGEGELNGTTVTCPWHGAEFDVTTGQVLGPPADAPVACYRVIASGTEINVELP